MLREKVYKRQNLVRRSKREQVTDAFSRAWRDGTKFNIILNDLGQVEVWQGRHVVASYDADEFAKEFMPEVLECQ